MQVWRKLVSVTVLFGFLLSTGCATIFSGSSDTVNINSEPSGGKIYINGNYMGNTPSALTLKRDKDYNIMIKKEGYEAATSTITRTFNAVSILNLTSPLCWVVDIVTGAMWKFDQNAVTVTLEKAGSKSSDHSLSKGRVVAGAGLKTTPYKGKTAIYSDAAPAK